MERVSVVELVNPLVERVNPLVERVNPLVHSVSSDSFPVVATERLHPLVHSMKNEPSPPNARLVSMPGSHSPPRRLSRIVPASEVLVQELPEGAVVSEVALGVSGTPVRRSSIPAMVSPALCSRPYRGSVATPPMPGQPHPAAGSSSSPPPLLQRRESVVAVEPQLTPGGFSDSSAPCTPIFGTPVTRGAPDAASQGTEFAKLVKSLEDRVDLMAQMQRARAQIQARAKEIEDSCTRSLSPAVVEGRRIRHPRRASDAHGATPPPPSRPCEPEEAHSPLQEPLREEFQRLNSETTRIQRELVEAREQMAALRSENDTLQRSRDEREGCTDRPGLAQENEQLWAQLREQRAHIAELAGALQGMQELMRTGESSQRKIGVAATREKGDPLSTALTTTMLTSGVASGHNSPAPTLSPATILLGSACSAEVSPDTRVNVQLQDALQSAQIKNQECQWLRQQLASEQQSIQSAAQDRIDERERLRYELGVAREALTRELTREVEREVEKEYTQNIENVIEDDFSFLQTAPDTGDAELVALKDQLTEQTLKLDEMRRRLSCSNGTETASAETAYDIGLKTLNSTALPSALSEPRTEPHSLASTLSEPHTDVAPFSRLKMGTNLSLSDDGFTASRTRGCRQSVVIGSAPLKQGPYGWYFEVEIRETVAGWVGGLGIGVTQTNSEEQLRRMPDKAWRMPRTYMAGYWGRVFCAGREYQTAWKPEELGVGARVGLLVTVRGDLLVFVGGSQVVWMEADIAVHEGTSSNAVFPVVDVFAATSSVTLRPHAQPPPPPWGTPCTPQLPSSPLDSPASSFRSTQHL